MQWKINNKVCRPKHIQKSLQLRFFCTAYPSHIIHSLNRHCIKSTRKSWTGLFGSGSRLGLRKFLALRFTWIFLYILSTLPLVRKVTGLIPRPVISDKASPTARHRRDASSELCCSGAKPRRWAPPLITRFGMANDASILKI